MNKLESNKITIMYFLMSVLVILIHSVNNETKFQAFFSENGIGQFAVPMFFFISGFLFFRNISSIEGVKSKLRKRVRTVLLPYLLWNLIYYAINLLYKPGSGISIISIYDAAFNYTYNPSFWFVCQLILLNVISPLLYYAFKGEMRNSVILILVISLLIYFYIDIPYINEDAIIYYYAGAIFSKLYNGNKVNFIDRRYILPTLILAIAMYVINRCIYYNIGSSTHLHRLFILSVIYTRLSVVVAMFYICDLIFRYDKTYSFMEHTFFLYAIHYMIVRGLTILMRFITYRYAPASAILAIETITFIMIPIICVVVSDKLSRYLSRRFHKAYAILTGDR